MANNRRNTRAQKEAQKAVSKIPFAARLIIFVLIAAALLISLFWQNEISTAFGLKRIENADYDGMSTQTVLTGNGGELNLHFVDVGQGDACVIELPDGRNMLIDSGENDSKDELIHYIEDNIKDDTGKTIAYFDIVIITHSDSDHCGEMKDVLAKFPAKTFYRPNQLASKSGFTDPGKDDLYGNYSSKDTATYANAVAAGYKNAEITFATNAEDDRQNKITPDSLLEGDEGYYEINFYSPTRDRYTDYNDYSPIIILEYAGNRVALSGDAEKTAEADFVNKATADDKSGKFSVFDDAFTVQAIKLGHHGSRTSSSEDYLEVLTTAVSRKDVRIIISCGLNNKYKHPHTEVLERLEKMGFDETNILRTDRNGDIAMSIKFDSDIGGYALFVGADVVRTEKAAVSLGVVNLTWKEIVFTVIIVAALVLVIIPLFTDMKKKARKAARKQ